jgi:hypothetical protein
MVHQTLVRFFLRDLGYKREPIYSLVVAKMIERKPTMRRRLRWSSMVAGVTSDSAPAPRFALAAADVGRGSSSKR